MGACTLASSLTVAGSTQSDLCNMWLQSQVEEMQAREQERQEERQPLLATHPSNPAQPRQAWADISARVPQSSLGEFPAWEPRESVSGRPGWAPAGCRLTTRPPHCRRGFPSCCRGGASCRTACSRCRGGTPCSGCCRGCPHSVASTHSTTLEWGRGERATTPHPLGHVDPMGGPSEVDHPPPPTPTLAAAALPGNSRPCGSYSRSCFGAGAGAEQSRKGMMGMEERVGMRARLVSSQAMSSRCC